MVADKFISKQKHPTLDLWIYNYTQRAQFDRVWNEETLQCRGLIIDSENNIVSRPFRKFFNLGELGENMTFEGDFTVTEKMDGSLGISYFDPVGIKWYIATRGSFVSDQAIVATRLLNEKYADFRNRMNPLNTYLFEIIYPQNRIVVDYGDEEKLVLLTVIETKTGDEFTYKEIEAFKGFIPIVPRFDGILDFTQIEQKSNAEGYVVYFPATGLRFKVKFDEYVRLHKIITGVNAKRIWEFLKEGQPLDALLERVPDEFFQWITGVKTNLKMRYKVIEADAIDLFTSIQELPTRKDQAIAIKDSPLRGIVFNMLDRKPYDQNIWKMIEPEFEVPFKVEVE